MSRDSSENNHYLQLLNRACKNAISLSKYEKQLTIQDHTIQQIQAHPSRFEICPDALSKAETRKQDIQTRINDIKESIGDLEDVVVQEWINELSQASDTDTRWKHIQLPTSEEDVIGLIDTEQFNVAIETLEKEAQQCMQEKVDADSLDSIRQDIKQAKDALQTMLQELQTKAEQELSRQQQQIDEWKKAELEHLDRFNETRLVREITHELMGLPVPRESLKENEEEEEVLDEVLVNHVTQRALNRVLGQELIKQFHSSKHNPFIYPPNHVLDQSLRKLTQEHKAKVMKQQQREKKLKASVFRLAKVEKESDELLALFEKNLNADPVKRLQHNLEHINDILSNHAELMTFLNQPDKRIEPVENKTVPKHIHLYHQDNSLSSALATSIAQYTEECLYSDIRQRLDSLESKINN